MEVLRWRHSWQFSVVFVSVFPVSDRVPAL